MKNNLFKILIIQLIAIFFSISNAGSQSADDLILMTESFPPFNFQENNKLQGIAIDLMEKMLEDIGSSLRREDIKLLPWARAYRDAIEVNNTVLFMMNRNEAREKLFKWVGPIIPTVYALIAKKERSITIESLNDLNKYRIGVVSKDLGEQLLLEAGINPENIDSVPAGELNVQKLNRGRIDLWNYELSVAKWIIKKAGFDVEDYEPVYILKEEASSYYAFHKKTDDEVIKKFQAALDKLKKKDKTDHQSEFDKIVNKYFQIEVRNF